MRFEESRIQQSCVRWFRLQYPDAVLYSVPNGGFRNGFEAAIMKGEGVLAGVPDLCIAHPSGGYPAMYVEMKRPKGRTTESQRAVQDRLRKAGYLVTTCYSFDDFIREVQSYMRLK